MTNKEIDHNYLSTYCLHGLCDSGECKLTCKICGNHCVCVCHWTAQEVTNYIKSRIENKHE